MLAQAPIQQTTANAQGHAHDVRDPVVYVCAAVEAGLDEFDRAAEGTCAYEDGEQSDAARARQREGECGEGDKVHQLVAALRRRAQKASGSSSLGDSWLSRKPRIIRGLGVPIRARVRAGDF